MEPTAMFGSILSNSIEVHSLELGVQVAFLVLLIKKYTTKNTAGIFMASFCLVTFTFSPIPEVATKPWYFFTGLICTTGAIEHKEYVSILTFSLEKKLQISKSNPFEFRK